MKLIALFSLLLLFRCCNVFFIQTYFVPDETWQATEVAHRFVYGYGYLTWEWSKGIRSSFHPAIVSYLFMLLKYFDIDTPENLIVAPCLLHAFIQAIADLYVYKVSLLFIPKRFSNWVLFCQMTSLFTFYCGTRTLINSIETCLTVLALFYWPWPRHLLMSFDRCDYSFGLLFAFLCCWIRPTNIVMWFYLGLYTLYSSRKKASLMLQVFDYAFWSLTFVLYLDYFYYQKWIFTGYNFFYENVVKSVAVFYGSHPFLWYFSQGMPVVCGPIYPVFLSSCAFSYNDSLRVPKIFFAMIFSFVLFFSFLSHKEFRFIFPVLPLVHICSGEVMSSLFVKKAGKIAVFLIVITNLCVGFYLSMVHQRGVIDVIPYLRQEFENNKVPNRDFRIHFLMPCHSTPFYSHFHYRVPMRFLTCEIEDELKFGYDAADLFYLNPELWLEDHYFGESEKQILDRVNGSGLSANQIVKDDITLPSHFVMFDSLATEISLFLEKQQYSECARFFHSHISDGRRSKEVLVFCKRY